MVAMMVTPRPQRVLMIGLGGGAFTSLLRRHFPELWIDAVEIDPVVVEAAKGFFGVREDERFQIHIVDGADFVKSAPGTYDLVFLDAYSGEGIPRKLASPAFFDAVKARVSTDGVVVANLWRPGGRQQAVVKTFRSAFEQTAFLYTSDKMNMVLFGMPGAPLPGDDLVRNARRFTDASNLSFDLARLAEKLVENSRSGGFREFPEAPANGRRTERMAE
jgi:spermidine synthase